MTDQRPGGAGQVPDDGAAMREWPGRPDSGRSLSCGGAMIAYEWRGSFGNAELNALHAEGFGHDLRLHAHQRRPDRAVRGRTASRTDRTVPN